MAPNPDTRKPVDELDLGDLRVFPVWEFAIDEEALEGRDETWVRPVIGQSIPRLDWALGLAAEFSTRGGRVFEGLIWANTKNGVELEGVAIISDGRYLPFGLPAGASPDLRKVVAKPLGLADHALFPLTFRLRLPLAGERTPRSGAYP